MTDKKLHLTVTYKFRKTLTGRDINIDCPDLAVDQIKKIIADNPVDFLDAALFDNNDMELDVTYLESWGSPGDEPEEEP